MNSATHEALVSVITDYDAGAQRHSHYNRYALPQYLERLEEIRRDVENGRPLRQAIIMGFSGHLQTRLLRACGMTPATRKERSQYRTYVPKKVA